MGVIRTSDTANATRHGGQVKSARLSNGVLVSVCQNATGNDVSLDYSTDDGATWANIFAVSNNGSTPGSPSLAVDESDGVYVAWINTSTGRMVFDYRYPTNAARTLWSTAQTYTLGTTGEVWRDPTLVAFPSGSGGWTCHVVVNSTGPTSGRQNALMWCRFDVNSSKVRTYIDNQVIWNRPDSSVPLVPTLAFRNTGDGKTIQGNSPDLFLGFSACSSGNAYGLRFMKATFSAGSWTWGVDRLLDDGTRYSDSYLLTPRLFYDGTRCVMAGAVRSGGTLAMVIIERDPGDTTNTLRYSLVDDANAIISGSPGYDSNGNVYLYGRQNSGAAGSRLMGYRRFLRSSQTLEPFTTVDATTAEPYVSVRPGYDAGIDMVYTDGSAAPYQVTHLRTSLNSAAPTVQSPADGAVYDFADPITLTWANSTGYQQTAYSIRRSTGGTTTYWNGSAWQAAVAWVSSAATSVTFAGGAWGSNGTSYVYSVAVRDATRDSDYSAVRSITGRDRPTVTITAPASDGATVTTSGPTITISTAAASGATLDLSAFRILTAAEYAANGATGAALWETTGTSYANSATAPKGTLQNGSYVAVARARQQAGDQLSAWAARTFTVTLATVTTPTLTATTPAGMPRVVTTAAWTRGSASGVATLYVQRLDDGTWTTISATPGGSSGNISATVTDATAPTGVPRSYRAFVVVTAADGELSQSAYSTTATATITVLREVIVNTATGAYSVVALSSSTRTSRPWSGEVLYPLDSDVPIVLSGVPARPEGQTVAACVSTAEGEALEALLLGVQSLLWRKPPTSDGAVRRDQLVRVKPGSVAARPFADDRVRWAACVVEFQWTEVG